MSVPFDSGYSQDSSPSLFHIRPSQVSSIGTLDPTKCQGIVIDVDTDGGLENIDRLNRYVPLRRFEGGEARHVSGAGFSFEHIRELQAKNSSVPIILKGVMTVEDALEAAKSGVSCVWVSNDNKDSDSVPSPISALRAISKALKKEAPHVEVWFSGGVRRGTDVVKAIAFGATAVFLDTSTVLFAMYSTKSLEGLESMINMINTEVGVAMILTYCKQISDVTEEQIIQGVR